MKRLASAALFSVLLAFGMGACLPIEPELADKCPGLLFCSSSIVPQNVVGGTCCINGDNPGSTIGYLAAFGSDRSPAGCFNSVADARSVFPNAPGIILCQAE